MEKIDFHFERDETKVLESKTRLSGEEEVEEVCTMILKSELFF